MSEKDLLFSIVEQAIKDFKQKGKRTDMGFYPAARYLLNASSSSNDFFLSFPNICNFFQIDPVILRKQLLKNKGKKCSGVKNA